MNDELGRTLKGAVVAYSRYYLELFLEKLTINMKILGQGNRCPGRDSNQEPLE
jgi:hypothetical protein